MANAESANLLLEVGIATGGTSADADDPADVRQIEPTSATLGPNIEATQSAAIRAGRTPPDQIRTNADGRGDIAVEMQGQANDHFFQAALQDDWYVNPNGGSSMGGADISLAADGSLTDEGAGSGFSGAAVGDIYYMTGSLGTPAWVSTNEGAVVIIAVTDANNIQVAELNGNAFTAVGQSAGCTISLDQHATLGQADVSNAAKWLWIQKIFTDGSSTFPGNIIESELFRSTRVNTMDITWTPGSIATLSMGILGAFPTVDAGVDQWPYSTMVDRPTDVLPAYTNKPLNGLDDVRHIIEDIDGTPNDLGATVTELSISLNNNVAADSVVGRFGAVQTRLGQAILTGRLSAFLDGKTLIDKMLSEVSTSLAWAVDDGAGNGYGFKLGNVRFTSVSTPVSGAGDIVLQQLEFNATAMTVTRFS
jgi:hypothetical protein